ncbi:MAG: RusA family crossover junction endodeoxyribonuclease [Candidatus Poribacteria bacterium]|nr:RusA family crossover junction endodeoxyribonuclease [Candidatus Poribacteria bacterium]
MIEASSVDSPIGDTIEFEIVAEPVSIQANRSRKDDLTKAIQDRLRGIRYLLTGEVSVDITWLIHPRIRMETDQSPDVDNIIKPILDGLTGLNGILIDDWQVQHVSCKWIDWMHDDQKLQISISHNGLSVRKKGLRFVRMTNTLCFPLDIDLQKPGVVESVLNTLQSQLDQRAQLEKLGANYGTISTFMPIQVYYHISRVSKTYDVLTPDELRNEVK